MPQTVGLLRAIFRSVETRCNEIRGAVAEVVELDGGVISGLSNEP
jgi:hypothetical protein